jgi:tetratricopeptide (TPR) repeat protein
VSAGVAKEMKGRQMTRLLLVLCVLLLAAAGCKRNEGPDKITAQLLRDLKSPEEENRRRAATLLGFKNTPQQKRIVMPVLAQLVEDKDPILAMNAHQALQQLTGDDTVPQERRAWEDYVKRLIAAWDKTGKPPEEIIKPEKAKLANEEGIQFMHDGDFLSAEARFLYAIGLDTNNANYHCNLAKCYLNMKRYDDALRFARRAITLNPDLGEAYMQEGDAYAAMEEPYKAINAYREAVKRDSEGRNWGVHHSLAKLYLKNAMLDEAQAAIEQAIKINPRQPHLFATAALIRYGREEYFKAWQEVQKIRELGYEPDPGFLAKLKIELRKMGMEFPQETNVEKPLPALDTKDIGPLPGPKKEPNKPEPPPEEEMEPETTEKTPQAPAPSTPTKQ